MMIVKHQQLVNLLCACFFFVMLTGCVSTKSTWPILSVEDDSLGRQSLMAENELSLYIKKPGTLLEDVVAVPNARSEGENGLNSLYELMGFDQSIAVRVIGSKIVASRRDKLIGNISDKISRYEDKFNDTLGAKSVKREDALLAFLGKSRLSSMFMNPGDVRLVFSYGISNDFHRAGVRAKLISVIEEHNVYSLCSSLFESQVQLNLPSDRAPKMRVLAQNYHLFSRALDKALDKVMLDLELYSEKAEMYRAGAVKPGANSLLKKTNYISISGELASDLNAFEVESGDVLLIQNSTSKYLKCGSTVRNIRISKELMVSLNEQAQAELASKRLRAHNAKANNQQKARNQEIYFQRNVLKN